MRTQTVDMPTGLRTHWTSRDLELMPDNSVRYEIIDGELFMSRSPHWHHQRTCGNIYQELNEWSRQSGLGEASITPGVLFDESDDVIPDVAWVSQERLQVLLDDAGHLTGAPELAVEVLSFGMRNEQRDRQAKRKLYEVQGVLEYWIADWRMQRVEIYRRDQGLLRLVTTLLMEDDVTSPLLPGFTCKVKRFFL